ncbi:hypothetical protein O6P43_016923 [Quillaja saponaria]|uniref:Uncharacterized protein n=1 Tax=Quillaja saponaria TaxID=32244 RepID=A0AAD7LNU4_QUISA|nr:hypothetical protein O6P43_016923 [Quillaja saponaria]
MVQVEFKASSSTSLKIRLYKVVLFSLVLLKFLRRENKLNFNLVKKVWNAPFWAKVTWFHKRTISLQAPRGSTHLESPPADLSDH